MVLPLLKDPSWSGVEVFDINVLPLISAGANVLIPSLSMQIHDTRSVKPNLRLCNTKVWGFGLLYY